MANNNDKDIKNEVVLNDDQIICSLTNKIKKNSPKEQTLQHMIAMLTEEYGFDANDLERDFSVAYEDDEKKRKQKVDIAVFTPGKAHDVANLERIVIVAKDEKVDPKNEKAGLEASLENILFYTDCEFGCWTNGKDLLFLHSVEDAAGQVENEDISNWPDCGQTMEDLEKMGERAVRRVPANESLVRTFKRCNDYIYGNEGRQKDGFWQLLYLIFTKLYDEKRRFIVAKRGETYRPKFWVGVKDMNTTEGTRNVASRIKGLFRELKSEELFSDLFSDTDAILLSDKGITFVASQLAQYSFLDATVDVKGTAYETIVSNTLKQARGQFFTPRNIIKCMVTMMDPGPNDRVLDPACGSGGFLVSVLDHVRRKIAANLYPDLDELHLEQKFNSPEVNDIVKEYAEKMIFGFDFDPDLKKAARMNMVMSGDGHANIFNINSLDYPDGTLPDVERVASAVMQSIHNSQDKDFKFKTADDNVRGKFDMIFTNPPFGAKVEVDASISAKYQLSSTAPEILFIEACYEFLKPGGKMAIVLPDGILGNPNTESVRKWILERFKLLVSIDLPVEAFMPQVGVQTSLLFLQKKTDAERTVPIDKEDYDVFMAIVEKVGKDRRGVPIYKRDDDGAEILFDHIHRWINVDAYGNERVNARKERIKHIDDDLLDVAKEYFAFKNQEHEN